jgi:hypothetical protein
MNQQSKKVVLYQRILIIIGIIDMKVMDHDVRTRVFVFHFNQYFSFHLAEKYDISGDPSVRTYRGHSVTYTLIRCYFSPSFTTGQKYIITGSSDGCIRSLYLLFINYFKQKRFFIGFIF